jgi:hypothetical protein
MRRITRPPALIVCLLVLAAAAAGAQTKTAILERGPFPVKGIPFLPPNVLPAFLGDYSLGGKRISVLFSLEALVLPREWKSLLCGPLRLAEVPEDAGRTVCLVEGAEQPFFVFFSFESPGGDWCEFIKAFRARFLYLRGFQGGSADVPFPAILEIGG